MSHKQKRISVCLLLSLIVLSALVNCRSTGRPELPRLTFFGGYNILGEHGYLVISLTPANRAYKWRHDSVIVGTAHLSLSEEESAEIAGEIEELALSLESKPAMVIQGYWFATDMFTPAIVVIERPNGAPQYIVLTAISPSFWFRPEGEHKDSPIADRLQTVISRLRCLNQRGVAPEKFWRTFVPPEPEIVAEIIRHAPFVLEKLPLIDMEIAARMRGTYGGALLFAGILPAWAIEYEPVHFVRWSLRFWQIMRKGKIPQKDAVEQEK